MGNLRFLVTPYQLVGRNVPWSKLISKIPNRSVAQARNRWIRMNKTPTTRKDGRPPNRCLTCNLPFKGHTCRGVWIPDVAEQCASPLMWTFEEVEKLAEEDGMQDPANWTWSE